MTAPLATKKVKTAVARAAAVPRHPHTAPFPDTQVSGVEFVVSNTIFLTVILAGYSDNLSFKSI